MITPTPEQKQLLLELITLNDYDVSTQLSWKLLMRDIPKLRMYVETYRSKEKGMVYKPCLQLIYFLEG